MVAKIFQVIGVVASVGILVFLIYYLVSGKDNNKQKKPQLATSKKAEGTPSGEVPEVFKPECSVIRDETKSAELGIRWCRIPGESWKMMETEMTQVQFKQLAGSNPSCFQTEWNEERCIEVCCDEELRSGRDNRRHRDGDQCCNLFFEDKTAEKLEGEVVCFPSRCAMNCPDCPVDSVSYNEAVQACSKIGARLPSRKEWLRAAQDETIERGERRTRIIRERNYNLYAYYKSGNKMKRPRTVKDGHPNAYMLKDLRGNVWEWIAERGCFGGAFGTFANNQLELDFNLCGQQEDLNHFRDDGLGFRCVRDEKN